MVAATTTRSKGELDTGCKMLLVVLADKECDIADTEDDDDDEDKGEEEEEEGEKDEDNLAVESCCNHRWPVRQKSSVILGHLGESINNGFWKNLSAAVRESKLLS